MFYLIENLGGMVSFTDIVITDADDEENIFGLVFVNKRAVDYNKDDIGFPRFFDIPKGKFDIDKHVDTFLEKVMKHLLEHKYITGKLLDEIFSDVITSSN